MSAKKPAERLLICNCQNSMDIDAKAIAAALDFDQPLALRSQLCRSEMGVFEAALAQGGPVHVACTAEAALFSEIAQEKAGGGAALRFTNIREQAGWCERKAGAAPKMAALLAEAAYDAKPAASTTLTSDGVCLVYGAGQAALDVAQALVDRLAVSLLLSDTGDAMAPSCVNVPIHAGRITAVSGHLGAFEIEVDGYADMLPSSRQALQFVMPRDGAKSRCDLIFDMSGKPPLISAHRYRDGYFRVDPNHPLGVARAMFDICEFVGEFEKPVYVSFAPGICAHARSGQVGCTNCLDNCPAGAIIPDGDHVRIDSAICGGCGSCSALCPTGAVSYAYPTRNDLIARAQVLISTYLGAGGTRPIVLLHDDTTGRGLIDAIARHGRGLPVNVLPLSLYSVFQIGHELIAAMLATGAEQVVVLAPPDKADEMAPLERQLALIGAVLSGLGFEGARSHLIAEQDPDAAEAALYDLPQLPPIEPGHFDPVGSKRDIARTALDKLHGAAPAPQDVVALPGGAPYGRLEIKLEDCTLCLACVGACPFNALSDSPDLPQLSFTEAACVQCGICVSTCPEHALALAPRYDFRSSALDLKVLKSEQPFECVRCHKPFGAKASIEKVVARLKGHSMFKGKDQIRLIQMCDDCRIITMAESNDDPFSGGERPRIRTTDDYLEAEAKAKAGGKKPEDFLG